MPKVLGSKDCGNSPKNRFVQDVAVALESGKAEPENFSLEVTWDQLSAEQIMGRPAVLKKLAARVEPATIVIEHAISHGKVGAANGEVILGNGHRRRFSHVLEFTNHKANCVAAIKSYA
jgi:hypothetical protein